MQVRTVAAAAAVAFGLSVGAPAIASADPWVPGSGPLHPIRHYAADLTHPFWAMRHPIRAMIP